MPSLSTLEREIVNSRGALYGHRYTPLDLKGDKYFFQTFKEERERTILPCSPGFAFDPEHGRRFIARCNSWYCDWCDLFKRVQLVDEINEIRRFYDGRPMRLDLPRRHVNGKFIGKRGKPISDKYAMDQVNELVQWIRRVIPMEHPSLAPIEDFHSSRPMPEDADRRASGTSVLSEEVNKNGLRTTTEGRSSADIDLTPLGGGVGQNTGGVGWGLTPSLLPYFKKKEYNERKFNDPETGELIRTKHFHISFFGVKRGLNTSVLQEMIRKKWLQITGDSYQVVLQYGYGNFGRYNVYAFDQKKDMRTDYVKNERRYSFSQNCWRPPRVKNEYHIAHKFLPKEEREAITPREFAFDYAPTEDPRFFGVIDPGKWHHFGSDRPDNRLGFRDTSPGCTHPQCRQLLDLTQKRNWHLPYERLKLFAVSHYTDKYSTSAHKKHVEELFEVSYNYMLAYRAMHNVSQHDKLATECLMGYVDSRISDWSSPLPERMEPISDYRS